jgi:hypothetical protein
MNNMGTSRQKLDDIHDKVTQLHTHVLGENGLMQRMEKVEAVQSKLGWLVGAAIGISAALGAIASNLKSFLLWIQGKA